MHRYSTSLEKVPNKKQPATGQPHSELETSKERRKGRNLLATYDEILAEDINMEILEVDQMGQGRRTSDISLGVRKRLSVNLNFLGPILRKRFCGGSSSSCMNDL